jgi:peptidyl-prolyl cis-trans isomerase SurA
MPDTILPRAEARRQLSSSFRAITGGLLSMLIATSVTACRSTPATTSAPEPVVSPDTWAIVDGQPITRDAVDKAFKQGGNANPGLSEEEMLVAKLSLLNDLIVQEILVRKANEQKLDVTTAEIDTSYNEAKKNIADDAFQQELFRRGLTVADMRDEIRRTLLTQKVISQQVGSKIAVTDQDVSDFFNANRAQFNVSEESYRVAQIAITPVRDPQVANQTGDDATTPQAAAQKAQMLMERLKAGASFGELAVGYSEDPESAPRGGDLGLIPVSRLMQAPPALRNAVLKKEPGSVTVASLDGGYTIVLVAAHEAPGQRDLSTPGVRDQISNELKGRKEQLLRAAYLTSIRNDAKVTNYLARRLVEGNGRMPGIQLATPVPAK